MKKRLVIWALPLAASMALVGCSAGSSTDQADPSASHSPAPGKSGPSEPVAEGVLSADQVEGIVSKLLEGDQTVQVIGDEQMQPQLKAAKDADAPSGIKPEKCAEMNAKYSVTDLTSSVSATATSTSETVGKVVQVFSVTDEATRQKISQALTLDNLDGCETVTVEQAGKELEAERQILPLDVDAEQALTMSTLMDAGGGQSLGSVVVQALDGNNFVLVTLQTGSQESAELASQAVELADQAFAEIEAVQ